MQSVAALHDPPQRVLKTGEALVDVPQPGQERRSQGALFRSRRKSPPLPKYLFDFHPAMTGACQVSMVRAKLGTSGTEHDAQNR
jgi:hypothetical protein